MSVFENTYFDEHEGIHFICDEASGLRAVIAIHNTVLGPALGGLRMYPYATEQEAVDDVLRLSRGMSFKNALANLPFGGGKAVVVGDPSQDKSPALFEALGTAINQLGGTYITAEDVGTTVEDMDIIRRKTVYARGTSTGVGDPSPHTARGVFLAIKAALQSRFGDDGFAGRTVAIQGLGSVGFHLAQLLHDANANLVVCDLDTARSNRAEHQFNARTVAPEEILSAETDVLAPCAMGAILHPETIGAIRAPIVCGAANNQLATYDCAAMLQERGILFVPDFVANAGGVISIALEGHATTDDIIKQVDKIGETVSEILKASGSSSPVDVAEALAISRIEHGRSHVMAAE